MITNKKHEAGYWAQFGKGRVNGQNYDVLLAEQYRQVHLNLITRWADVTAGQVVLKTDLFAEAVSPSRAFLWGMLKADNAVIGIDVSGTTTSRARINSVKYAPDAPGTFVNCDVRQLPFMNDSLDFIVSDSTLDHFAHTEEIDAALAEFKRVLKPGGRLIVTMDNKSNLTEPLFRLWIRLGLAPFFIGKTYSIGELHRALARAGLGVTASTAIIHNPRFFTKVIIALLRKIGRTRFDGTIKRGLAFLDSLENSKVKYLTAQFIAVKAVKPST
jgi:ubiquinone/menaquinone biosynthesis C-methylase UbiE